jgi:VWFA-related protein
MRDLLIRPLVGIFVAGLMSALLGVGAGGQNSAPANAAQVTVTVRPREPGVYPFVTPEDVMVYEDGKRRPVVSWLPANTQPAVFSLTVLVDDSVHQGVATQFKDLADFFSTLPAGTRFRIAYATNGGIRVEQDFTSDYSLAAKSLHIPLGSSAGGGSIYESVTDLLKHWPRDGNQRELLLISDGIDINQNADPSQNTNLQQAINVAQSTNTPVYALFARGGRAVEGDSMLLNFEQGALLRLTSETGGQAYFEGTHTPIAFAPYLKEYADDLAHQYLLTFKPLPAPKKGYQPLHVSTEVPGVRLEAPARIFIPKEAQ